MNGVVIGALMALGMIQQTDTVFPAQGARVLELDLMGGSVLVTGWDREEVSVKARHSSRTHVEVRRSRDGARLEVGVDADRGPAPIVDFEISLPRRMSVAVDALTADVTATGVRGGLDISVNQGDVTIRGGGGPTRLYVTAGRVLVEDLAGDVEAETAAGEIRLIRVTGAVSAESAGGDVVLEGITSSSVDAGTVGGRVHYEGSYQAGGSYFFGTHGGSVTLVVPEGTSATFNLATAFGSVVDARGAEARRLEGGRRHTVEVGGGAALVEAETFGGRILLTRKGAEGSAPAPPRRDARDAGLQLIPG